MSKAHSEGKFYFKFLQIPAEALLNPKLSYTDMIIFSFIKNLSTSDRGCWAENSFFADILRVTKRTVSASISTLCREDYLFINISGSDNKRHIYVNEEYQDRYNPIVNLFNRAYVDNDQSARDEFKKIK